MSKEDRTDSSSLSQKIPLRLITCGSVDDGKSTLIGRLLWDSQAVFDDQIRDLDIDLNTQNQTDDPTHIPEFARLLDGLQIEKEQGITVDVAYRYFSTKKRSFIIADTPGHQQYTRNMATGCSTATLAILLIDARNGLQEQTWRHASIATLMGVKHIILAVNKIDLVQYQKKIFDDICHHASDMLSALGLTTFQAVPLSALKGENVVQTAPHTMPWYTGATLLEMLEQTPSSASRTTSFRLPVQAVIRAENDFRGYQGTVTGGSIKPGDPLVVLPSRQPALVSQIVTFDLVRNAAVQGDAITLVLDRHVDIARGDILVSPTDLPFVSTRFEAHFIWMTQMPPHPTKRYVVQAGGQVRKARLSFTSCLNFDQKCWQDAATIAFNDIGKGILSFEEPAIFDTFASNRRTGCFIVIDPETHETVAAGMILGQLSDLEQTSDSNVSGQELTEYMILKLPRAFGKDLINSTAFKEIQDHVQISYSDDPDSF